MATATQLSLQDKVDLYASMYRIRVVEEALNDCFARNLVPGFIHSSMGQEACAVGVCHALRNDDYVLSSHRPRGHYLAKGMPLKPMLAEVFGRRTGISRGRGGEMHSAFPGAGILGGNGIVGSALPMAVGAAYSAVVRGSDQVTTVFFGEGAATTGAFAEAMNMAVIWRLPLVFACENNLYIEMTPIQRVAFDTDIAKRAGGYGARTDIVDGNDVLAVREAAFVAVQRARAGEGPTFLEMKTYRWGGHFEGDPCRYRTREEEERWKQRCPLKVLRGVLAMEPGFRVDALAQIEAGTRTEVADAMKFAMESELPEADDLYGDVYAAG